MTRIYSRPGLSDHSYEHRDVSGCQSWFSCYDWGCDLPVFARFRSLWLVFYTEAANIGFNVLQSVLCAIVSSIIITASYIKVSRTIGAHNANLSGAVRGGRIISVDQSPRCCTLWSPASGVVGCRRSVSC